MESTHPVRSDFSEKWINCIGSRHDIEFPVTGTAEAVMVQRADQLAAKTKCTLPSQENLRVSSESDHLEKGNVIMSRTVCWLSRRKSSSSPVR